MNNNLVEVIGTIQNLLNKGDASSFYFTLQTDDNRLLTVKYEHKDSHVSQSVYESLKEGISVKKQNKKELKVQILVEGPIERTKDFYKGVGSITIVD